MSRRLHCLLSVLPLCSALLAAEPEPATIRLPGGNTMGDFFVTSETIEGITFVTDPKDPNAAQLHKSHGQYSVEYKPSMNRELNLGKSYEDSRNVEQGITAYATAAGAARFDWERQAAALGAGRLAQSGKPYYDTGIKILGQMLKDYPTSVNALEASYLLGRLQQLNGDQAGALATAQALSAHADWGIEAQAMGAVLSAQIQIGANQAADAITALKPWFTDKLSATKNPDEFAQVGMTLAQAQIKTSDPGVLQTLRQVAYAPCSAARQSAAHLAWASFQADKQDAASLHDAFDHAAIAVVMPGVEPLVRGQALSLATALVPRIIAGGVDDQAKNKLKIEYNGYISKMQ
jgi:hypothetical protein